MYWIKLTGDERLGTEFITEASDKKVNRYTLQLPTELRKEYFDEAFKKNFLPIAAVHIIIILIIIYGVGRGFSKGIQTSVLAVRGVFMASFICFGILGLFKRQIYKKYYHPFMLIGITLYFPTVFVEFYSTNIRFMIFFLVLVFCGLYATGCYFFLRVLGVNFINILITAVALFAVNEEPVGETFVHIIFLIMVLILGGAFLYILEKSRKQNFVFSNRLEKQSNKLLQEKTKSERLLLNILPNSVARNLKKRKQIGIYLV